MNNGAATGMDLVCAYSQDPASTGLDREQLHGELRDQTQGFSQLGPYMLQQDSLVLDGEGHGGLLLGGVSLHS